MLPKWFNDWNEKNPTNIFGPGIVVGAVGGAVFFAAMIVAWGQPFATASTQTGPRGTGMSITDFKSDLAEEDPTIGTFVTSDPIKPQPGDKLAKDEYPDVPESLQSLTVANYDRLVEAMRAWTGIEVLFNGEDNYQTQVAVQMISMTQNLNEGWDDHVNANGQVGVTCATCHRGQAVPSNVWYNNTPLSDKFDGWSAVQNRATSTSSSTSLPSDALAKLLVDGEQISVHDLESRVAGSPADGETRTIQDTERTYALMNYFANSLGVNCNFCHNSRAFYDPEQVTPQWSTASLGIGMVQEQNEEYILPLAEILPAERLGVQHGDVPKLACATCHKGYSQPYQGLNVIKDWPELATTEAPVYE